jgi:hypothetical protein
MRHDPIGGLYYGNVETWFSDFVLVAHDDAGEVIACAYSIPFVLGDEALRDERLSVTQGMVDGRDQRVVNEPELDY